MKRIEGSYLLVSMSVGMSRFRFRHVFEDNYFPILFLKKTLKKLQHRYEWDNTMRNNLLALFLLAVVDDLSRSKQYRLGFDFHVFLE